VCPWINFALATNRLVLINQEVKVTCLGSCLSTWSGVQYFGSLFA
jgi:hypothetical protein